MLPGLEYIKQTRVRLGITQRKLATLTGISTSMVNQIESGRCKPSYETARKIFEILSSLEGRTSMKAGDICSRSPISVQKDEKLHEAIDVMRVNSISQIPVFDSSRVVGILTEDGLAKVMLEKKRKGSQEYACIRGDGTAASDSRCLYAGQGAHSTCSVCQVYLGEREG